MDQDDDLQIRNGCTDAEVLTTASDTTSDPEIPVFFSKSAAKKYQKGLKAQALQAAKAAKKAEMAATPSRYTLPADASCEDMRIDYIQQEKDKFDAYALDWAAGETTASDTTSDPEIPVFFSKSAAKKYQKGLKAQALQAAKAAKKAEMAATPSRYTLPADASCDNLSGDTTIREGTLKKLIEEDGLGVLAAGKGATSGYVKCPLCNAKTTQFKKFAYGRGFTMHLQSVHPMEDHAQAVLDSRASLTAPGFSKNGEKATNYADSLPIACAAAKRGDLKALQDMRIDYIQQEKDKFGANALDWAAGEGYLPCVHFLAPHMHWCTQSKQPIRRRDGKSCLHWSCRNGHIEVTQYLLEHLYLSNDALVRISTGDGTSPTQLAAFGGHVSILQWIYHTYGPHALPEENRVLDLFSHTNNWGCFPEHFVCMSPKLNQALLRFFIESVHEGSFGSAAAMFFASVNTEGMTPVHKWLLHLEKSKKEDFDGCLLLFHELLAHLPGGPTDLPPPPEGIHAFVLERIRKSDVLTSEQKEMIKSFIPSITVSRNKERYRTLGLKEKSCPSDDDVKKAYYSLCLLYHPDRQSGKDGWEKEAAKNTFERIQEAYETLSENSGQM